MKTSLNSQQKSPSDVGTYGSLFYYMLQVFRLEVVVAVAQNYFEASV